MRIAIVPVGTGNLGSLRASLRRLSHESAVWESPSDIQPVDWVVLPGVGSANGAADRLNKSGLTQALSDIYVNGPPLLGICLGLQLAFSASEEGGQGLGFLPGDVVKLSSKVLPHMGWNTLVVNDRAPAWLSSYHGCDFYFVHSYYVRPRSEESVAAVTTHEDRSFASVVIDAGRFVGLQFHPELSGDTGESLLADILQRGWEAS